MDVRLRGRHKRRYPVNILFAALLVAAPVSAAEPLRVFAAASLTDALDDVLAQCPGDDGTPPMGVYAGSGTLARQIEQGAPADIVISANPDWMDWLADRGMIDAKTRKPLLSNRLVVISTREQDAERDWTEALRSAGDSGIAVADLASVPAGIYARQALAAAGLLDGSRLIQASNVREALTWVTRGALEMGIVYRSDAMASGLGHILPIDPALHDPIRYPMARVTGRGGAATDALMQCLGSEKAAAVFKRHRFIPL
jgi:molybdate transport system substrate-binding protein